MQPLYISASEVNFSSEQCSDWLEAKNLSAAAELEDEARIRDKRQSAFEPLVS